MILRTVLRCFNVEIILLCISAIDNAKKLKFSSYVHLAILTQFNPLRQLSDFRKCRQLINF